MLVALLDFFLGIFDWSCLFLPAAFGFLEELPPEFNIRPAPALVVELDFDFKFFAEFNEDDFFRFKVDNPPVVDFVLDFDFKPLTELLVEVFFPLVATDSPVRCFPVVFDFDFEFFAEFFEEVLLPVEA